MKILILMVYLSGISFELDLIKSITPLRSIKRYIMARNNPWNKKTHVVLVIARNKPRIKYNYISIAKNHSLRNDHLCKFQVYIIIIEVRNHPLIKHVKPIISHHVNPTKNHSTIWLRESLNPANVRADSPISNYPTQRINLPNNNMH